MIRFYQQWHTFLSSPPSSPNSAVVATPKTSMSTLKTRPRNPNAFKKFIPVIPGYEAQKSLTHTEEETAQESSSQSRLSKELSESFKTFERKQQAVKEEVTIIIEVVR